MKTSLITTGVWGDLTKAIRASKRPSYIAVAYLGKGAAQMLPVKPNSKIVVDASRAAVKTGQTCPNDLIALSKNRGARIYSVGNLHAKIFVLDKRVFIGSANASHHSAKHLIEAVISSSSRSDIAAGRQFVQGLCLEELGPTELELLQRIYRPPAFAKPIGGGRSNKVRAVVKPAISRVMLAQLVEKNRPEEDADFCERNEAVARERMDAPRRHFLDDFFWQGLSSFRKGDTLLQVVERNGRKIMYPPGRVIHMARRTYRKRVTTYVYLERRRGRGVALNTIGRRLGRGALKRLNRGGQLPQDMAAAVLAAWST